MAFYYSNIILALTEIGETFLSAALLSRAAAKKSNAGHEAAGHAEVADSGCRHLERTGIKW